VIVKGNRLADVLEKLLTEWLELQRQLVLNLVVDTAGDADPAGLGDRLDPRGDVDAVA